MTEQFVISRVALIANYSSIAVSFILFVLFELRAPSHPFRQRLFLGYATCYVTFVLIVQVIDRYITYRVYSFDHDGDQVFQNHELVGDLGFLWSAMINDTGRNLSPITGLFTAVVGTGVAYGLALACIRLVKYWRARFWSS